MGCVAHLAAAGHDPGGQSRAASTIRALSRGTDLAMSLAMRKVALLSFLVVVGGGNVTLPPDETAPDADPDPSGDAEPPDTALTAVPAAITRETSTTFEFEATEEATFACSLDGAAATPCESPHTVDGLA